VALDLDTESECITNLPSRISTQPKILKPSVQSSYTWTPRASFEKCFSTARCPANTSSLSRSLALSLYRSIALSPSRALLLYRSLSHTHTHSLSLSLALVRSPSRGGAGPGRQERALKSALPPPAAPETPKVDQIQFIIKVWIRKVRSANARCPGNT
jgi:hypothetical protein